LYQLQGEWELIVIIDGLKKIVTQRQRHSLFYLIAHLAVVTVRPIDLVSRVYKTHQLVYRCARKTNYITLC